MTISEGRDKLLPRLGLLPCPVPDTAAYSLALLLPVCCFKSPTGQKGPIGLLQLDSIPPRQCPPVGAGVVATIRHQTPCGRSTGRLPHQWRHRTWPTRTQCPPPPIGHFWSSPGGGSWSSFWRSNLPGVLSRPSQYVLICWVLLASSPHYRSQLTTRWWSVDSSAPLFTWCPGHAG